MFHRLMKSSTWAVEVQRAPKTAQIFVVKENFVLRPETLQTNHQTTCQQALNKATINSNKDY